MKENIKAGASNLRQKAESLLKMEYATISPLDSEAELLKLIYELKVYKSELNIQNDELNLANEKASVEAEKYTHLFDYAPSGYFILSKEGEIIESNHSGRKLIGNERRSLYNDRFSSYLSTDSKQIFNEFLTKTFKSKSEESCIVSLSIDNKIPIYVLLKGLAYEKNENCLVNMVDISNIKKAEEELKNKVYELTSANNEIAFQNDEKEERAAELIIINKKLEQSLQLNTDKNLFMSILAHDMRSPFTVILGYSELLLENIRKIEIDKIELFAKEIYQSTQLSFNLLVDLLKWSRLQSGKIPFEPQKLDFTIISKDILKLSNSIANSKNITINYSALDGITVFADSDMFKAILRNLISNAIKFTPNNGTININAVENSGYVTISVADNGVGIEPEMLQKLFDISQNHTTRDLAGEKGTGLGLVLCKEFVEKHKGKIWVESEVGKGSIFYFTIPANEELKEMKVVENIMSAGAEGNQIKNLKILIVDDNEPLRIILGEMVKRYGKEILYAKTGNEAVDTFRNNPDIDLILMDLYMPGMNGNEATRIIRQISKKVIIIVETADTFSGVTEEFAGIAINDYLPKPYNKPYLNQLITKHFSRKNKR